jgi:hypothetical protein
MLKEIYEYINIKIDENSYLMEVRILMRDVEVFKEKLKYVRVKI